MGDGIDPKYASEFTPEEFERLNCRIAELHKAWDDRLELSSPRFVERYLAGEIDVHLRVSVGPLHAVPEHLCALLGRPDVGSNLLRLRKDKSYVSCTSRVDADCVWGAYGEHRNHQELVFLGDVEVMQDEQRIISGLRIPVRLHSFDYRDALGSDPLYYSILKGRFELVPLFMHGKRDLEAGVLVPAQCESPHQMIETRPELVQDFTDDDAEAQRNGSDAVVESLDNKKAVFSLVAKLYSETIEADIRIKEPLKFRGEISDVLVGPFNLRGNIELDGPRGNRYPFNGIEGAR